MYNCIDINGSILLLLEEKCVYHSKTYIIACSETLRQLYIVFALVFLMNLFIYERTLMICRRLFKLIFFNRIVKRLIHK